MRKIKITILEMIVLIIILIVSVIGLKFKNNNSNNEIILKDEDLGEEIQIVDEVTPVKDANIFYSVSYTIDKYFSNLYVNDNFTEEEKKEKAVYLCNVLDKEFIKNEKISQNTVLEILKGYQGEFKFTATKMNQLITKNNYQTYIVKGILEKSGTNEYLQDCYFKVIVNSDNNTYSIYPIMQDMYSDISEINVSNNDNIEEIEKNKDNEFIILTVNDDNLIKRYIAYYKNMALNHTEMAYELLNDEYRNKRFKNLESFIKNTKQNKDVIDNIIIDKYKVEQYDDYILYIVVDIYNNYYIFKETAIMQFDLMLDTYTIDSEEFLKKYNNGSEQLKVGMNLEKIFQALNRKDYEYIYSKLHEQFKENNFPTLQSFEKYMQENFFDMNKITYGKFEEKSGAYVYEIEITDATETEENTIEKSFIIQLGEGTDFVMSFNK